MAVPKLPAHPLVPLTLCVLLTVTVIACDEPSQPLTDTSSPALASYGAGSLAITPLDLGTLGGPTSTAYAVNAVGQVVGASAVDATGASRPFLWDGAMTDLGALDPGSSFGQAMALNARGQVVGASVLSWGDRHAFLWESGTMTDLGTLGGAQSQAMAISDEGTIVGWAGTWSGETHAFLWTNGVMRDLGTLGGTLSEARGINNRGQAVGMSTLGDGRQVPFLWEDGAMSALSTLGGRVSAAWSINDRGQIAGESQTPAGQSHAVLWENGVLSDLGAMGGTSARAYSINNLGQVVGQRVSSSGPGAFLWENGAAVTLETLGGTFAVARSINDGGLIAGISALANGRTRATLWIPQPPSNTGAIALTVTTTGGLPDPDGYLVSLDGHGTTPVPANGAVTFDHVVAGTHTLVATGAAANCTFVEDTLEVTVQGGETATAQLTATCHRIFDNDILFTTEQFGVPQIMIMRPDGTGRERITNDPYPDGMGAPSPDGLRIAFVSYRDGNVSLYLMTADGTDVRKLADAAGEPAWSPDGAWIAYRGMREGPYGQFGRIFIIGPDGSGLRQASPDTPDYTFDDNPSWSPDGARIAFTRNGMLYTMAPDGGELGQVGPIGADCDEPRWSPDGAEIAFSMTADGNTDIYRMNADGSNVLRITTDPGQENYPTWSPDGTQLAFQRVVDDLLQIFRVGRDGGVAVRLSAVDAHEYSPFWSRAR